MEYESYNKVFVSRIWLSRNDRLHFLDYPEITSPDQWMICNVRFLVIWILLPLKFTVLFSFSRSLLAIVLQPVSEYTILYHTLTLSHELWGSLVPNVGAGLSFGNSVLHKRQAEIRDHEIIAAVNAVQTSLRRSRSCSRQMNWSESNIIVHMFPCVITLRAWDKRQ